MDTVLIVGTGLIAISFAERFLAHGWDVRMTNVNPKRKQLVEEHFHGKVSFSTSLTEAARGVDFVQEAAPERLELKRELFAELAGATGDGTVLASSTSAILPSQIAEGNPAAGRILIGHPFTPPALMPVLEIVPGPQTSSEVVERARNVYRGIGLDPSVLKKEIPGFVGNRIQKVIMWELIGLVQSGVVDVTEADRIVRNSLGLRYAAVGPFEANQLGGGERGIRGLFANIAGNWDETLTALQPDLTDMDGIFDAAERAYGGPGRAERRDRMLRGFLEVREQEK
ncbi:hypothetical protein HMPREF1219_01959 [Corynebacterium pyruviciproducens ATCC BAA-1742]|uniref:3-hydroxyacyl-CoA dehydrogenase n=1 Tax=Corynebacterium pyruviciproducens ATCC BAA-1742 TaxID=1125779 RepID=S2ZE93_9CORY|nr:3-hydroxyacyl-CoA dehydrogenase NAD-binding domain-containing protein [Corynebacterium pyruviciproducens]EPD68312.1 hypothetical protein HMPREF1219_01959 [Corynebacterium pyruviciproducens ATCC BAA-1742]